MEFTTDCFECFHFLTKGWQIKEINVGTEVRRRSKEIAGLITTGGSMYHHKPSEPLPVPISVPDLEIRIAETCRNVGDWLQGGYAFVRKIEEANRNHGQVDLMKSAKDGQLYAVKVMPTEWVRESLEDFQLRYPQASERPWFDLGCVRQLQKVGYPYICELVGIYRDDVFTYVVSPFASEGDLFGWCHRKPLPGPRREEVIRPIVQQLFDALKWIHVLGVAHRDVSLENILVTRDRQGELQIKLIDFGMATLKRHCRDEPRGKQSYQAPEMHKDGEYDAFLADSFSTGVVVFGLAVQDYPWIATTRSQCQLFEFVESFGLRKLLERRRLRKADGERLAKVMSEGLVDLLDGLLALNPDDRWTFGEPCWDSEPERRHRCQHGLVRRRAVWECSWMADHPALRHPSLLRRGAASGGYDYRARSLTGSARNSGASTPASSRLVSKGQPCRGLETAILHHNIEHRLTAAKAKLEKLDTIVDTPNMTCREVLNVQNMTGPALRAG
eukprot:TRINITY_DN102984_c0_g1_i1.p1 TRINITY_DN102984_c0_g1~~TRINITY_DN102984_c0_g1_i1.p1  ORF type:complete len:500 (+),score=82.18 TRINITY_DN102984_c0_g1_i1:140-1639(+)